MQEESILDSLWKFVRKFFLSAFVIFTFLAYVVHEQFGNVANALLSNLDPKGTNGSVASLSETDPTTGPSASSTPDSSEAVPTAPPSIFQPDSNGGVIQSQPTSEPTALPTGAPAVQGQYLNGDYVGPQVDAFYGLVQVKATIQDGQIVGVDFLQFPSDRRTSQRINRIAMPYLQTEALRAQSANVNIISGATLTSEAFMMSLDAALSSAKP